MWRFAKQAMFGFKKQVYVAAAGADRLGDRRARRDFAESAGIPRADFLACYLREESLADVRKDLEEGQRLGVKSTPTYFVDGTEILWAEDKVMEDFLRTKDPNLKSIDYAPPRRRGRLTGARRFRASRFRARTESGRSNQVRTFTPSFVDRGEGPASSDRPRSRHSRRGRRGALARTTRDLERARPVLGDEDAQHDDAADPRLERQRGIDRLHDRRDPGRRVDLLERDERALAHDDARGRGGTAVGSGSGCAVGMAAAGARRQRVLRAAVGVGNGAAAQRARSPEAGGGAGPAARVGRRGRRSSRASPPPSSAPRG